MPKVKTGIAFVLNHGVTKLLPGFVEDILRDGMLLL